MAMICSFSMMSIAGVIVLSPPEVWVIQALLQR
jgi:hypothetical protein